MLTGKKLPLYHNGYQSYQSWYLCPVLAGLLGFMIFYLWFAFSDVLKITSVTPSETSFVSNMDLMADPNQKYAR